MDVLTRHVVSSPTERDTARRAPFHPSRTRTMPFEPRSLGRRRRPKLAARNCGARPRARGARPNGGGRGGVVRVPQSNSPDRTTSSPGCHLVEPPLRAGRDEREASETEREMEEEAELMMMTTTTRIMMVMMMPSMIKQRQRQVVVLLTPAAPCRTMGGAGGGLPSARCRASSFDRRMPRRLLTPRHALPVGWLPAACASRSQHAHLMSVGTNSARRRRRAWSSMTLHEMT